MRKMRDMLSALFSPGAKALPVVVILAAAAAVTGRYLLFGVPHEFITGEYKGTFEGDYDFTLELVRSVAEWGRLPLWSDTFSGPIAVFASNFHVFEQALLYPFTGSLSLSIKILQVTQILVAGFGMYTLARHLFTDRAAAVFSATLYMFTPFFIGHLLSYLHYTGVYMLAPLVFYLILRTVAERSFRHALVLSLAVTYSLLSHPQNVFIGGIFYALFFVLAAARGLVDSVAEGEARRYVAKMAAISVVVVAVTFLLSAFITLPTLADNYPYLRTSWAGGAPGLVDVDHGHIGSHSQSVLAAVSMQHWPWLSTPLKGGEYPGWGFMAVYLMPFVFTAVSLVLRFSWITLALTVLTVLSVQMSLGIKGVPDLFTLASRHLPFFGMSRTPYSYVNIAFLVFCLLPAVTFRWLADRVEGWQTGPGKGPGAARWLLYAALAAPYLYGASWYGSHYNWTFISAKEPAYLSAVWGWMEEKNTDRGRVVETCGIPTAMLLNSRMLPNQVDLLERYERKDYLGRYLSLLGLNYVITPRMHSQRSKTFDRLGYTPPSVFDRGEGMNEYYSALTTEYYHVFERLSADPGFTLHTAGTKDVAIFENLKRLSDHRLYAARPVLVLGGTESYDLLNRRPYSVDAEGPPPAAVFIAQSANRARLDDLLRVSEDLVLHNTDALDLYMLGNTDRFSISRPEPVDTSDWSLAIYSFGIQQPFPVHDHSIGNSLFGELTFADFAMKAERAGSSFVKDFTVDREGVYTLLVRSYGGPGVSDLRVTVDGRDGGTVGQKDRAGYRWLALWQGELAPGAHTMTAALAEDLPAYIDSVAVAETSLIESSSDEVRAAMRPFDAMRRTYMLNFRRFVERPGKTLSTDLRIAPGGFYTPVVRLARFSEVQGDGSVALLIDGHPAGSVPFDALSDAAAEFTLSPVELAPGSHTVTLAGLVEGVYFDYAALSTGPPASTARRSEGAITDDARFGYTRTGPSEFRVEVEGASTEKPLFVVLNETNYPGWRLSFSGAASEPVVTNMFTSGFILDPVEGRRRGDGVIYYSNTAQRTGVWLSVVTFFTVCTIVIASRFRRG